MFDTKNKGNSQDSWNDSGAAVGATVIEGFYLSREFADEQPRIRDVELGERLGYSRVRDIRALIKSLLKTKKLSNVHNRGAAPRPHFGANVADTEYWLTRTETLIVIVRSDTAIAYQITEQIITVFEAFLDGKFHARPASPPPPSSPQLGDIMEQLKRLSAAVEALQSGPSAATGAVSPTQYAALRSDAGVLARWEHRAGLASSVAAARASIDQDLRSRTGWGGKSRPWTTLPAHLLAEARTVLRERMARSRAQVPEGDQLALPYDPDSKLKH